MKRWVNLWPPASFAESFIPASEPILQARSLRLQIASDEFEPGEEGASGSTEEGISSAVFLGNFTLFVALLSSIFLVHVVLASAIEAYWLAKVRTCGLLFLGTVVDMLQPTFVLRHCRGGTTLSFSRSCASGVRVTTATQAASTQFPFRMPQAYPKARNRMKPFFLRSLCFIIPQETRRGAN